MKSSLILILSLALYTFATADWTLEYYKPVKSFQSIFVITSKGCYCNEHYAACSANKLYITDRESEINCNKIHNPNAIHSFLITNSTINYIPTELLIYKNLVELEISGAGLKELLGDDLKEFTRLEFLSLTYNNIESLQKDLFTENKLLKTIDLTGNKINFIDAGIFSLLSRLESLRLSDNECIDCSSYNKQYTEFVREVADTSCNGSSESSNLWWILAIVIATMILGLLIGVLVWKCRKSEEKSVVTRRTNHKNSNDVNNVPKGVVRNAVKRMSTNVSKAVNKMTKGVAHSNPGYGKKNNLVNNRVKEIEGGNFNYGANLDASETTSGSGKPKKVFNIYSPPEYANTVHYATKNITGYRK